MKAGKLIESQQLRSFYMSASKSAIFGDIDKLKKAKKSLEGIMGA